MFQLVSCKDAHSGPWIDGILGFGLDLDTLGKEKILFAYWESNHDFLLVQSVV